MVAIRGDVHMVDPHVVRSLDTNGISIFSKDFGDCQVANDDVADAFDVEPGTSKAYKKLAHAAVYGMPWGGRTSRA